MSDATHAIHASIDYVDEKASFERSAREGLEASVNLALSELRTYVSNALTTVRALQTAIDAIQTALTGKQGALSSTQMGYINSVPDKVDKVNGKGLSANDFTDSDKTKLNGIEAGAEKNVQPDWNAVSGDAAIQNKPSHYPPEQHVHQMEDVVGLDDLRGQVNSIGDHYNELTGVVDGKVSKSAFRGLALPDGATQKDIRIMLQTLITRIGATVLAVFASFYSAYGDITRATPWEEVPPGTTLGAVADMASPTGTVARAASVGTAEQWVDATGCVWRVLNDVVTRDGVVVDVQKPRKIIGPEGAYYDASDSLIAGDIYRGSVGTVSDGTFTWYSETRFFDEREFHEYIYYVYDYLTNLVGRVALTNDTMPRAEAEARFDAVDRPYSMIYDPVAGRALTADGRLVDYGRAPRIAGHFVLTPDAAMSSGNLPDGFMPTLALLGGRTNLVEGVDWTSAVTPSSPDGSGGYYVSTADIAWSQTNAGYYTVGVLPVSVQIVKTVSSFGTSCTLSLGSVVSPYYVVDVPGVGTGEVSIYGSDIAGDTVMLYWSFYDYTYWTSYYGSDVFRLRFVDEGGDGVQAVAFGNRGRFATLSDMQSQVEEAVDDRVGSMDSVRSLEIMRTDGPLELGSGPGILKWDFVTDDREWILTVPNLSAAMRVYTSYSGTTEYTGYPYDSYAVPEIRERTFVRSWGNAGNGRCLASQWHVVGAIGDAEFIVDAIVSNGAVRVLSNVQEPPIYGMSIGDPAYPSASFGTYSGLDLSGDGTSSVRFYRGTLVSGGPSGSSTTRWPTLHLTTASGSYTVVTGAYMRALGPETKDLHWDAGLHRTWRVGVSNGCFFAEIVSTNNLLYTVTHQ